MESRTKNESGAEGKESQGKKVTAQCSFSTSRLLNTGPKKHSIVEKRKNGTVRAKKKKKENIGQSRRSAERRVVLQGSRENEAPPLPKASKSKKRERMRRLRNSEILSIKVQKKVHPRRGGCQECDKKKGRGDLGRGRKKGDR